MTLHVRREVATDIGRIDAIVRAAFPTDAEARLVVALRTAGRLVLSLVAEQDGVLSGHLAFSPVTVGGVATAGLGLAPVAVLPDRQNQGIGTEMIRAGLIACREMAVPFVVVLGNPRYYGRFGFTRADAVGLPNEYLVGPEFMVAELSPGGLPGPGLVRYAPEFASVA